LRVPGPKRKRATARARGRPRRRTSAGQRAATLSARLLDHVTLDRRPNGSIAVNIEGEPLELGKLGADAAARAQALCTGFPLVALDGDADQELHLLIRRLAAYGLLEYRLGHKGKGGGRGDVVIEPQLPGYWPRTPPLADADLLVLSRFAYLRRRGNELVLESPLAGALFRIGDAGIATAIAELAQPQSVKQLRRLGGFPARELLALLLDCRILFKLDPARAGSGLRPEEGDDALVLWDFHDLLFHTRSTSGRHANPTGGTYPYVGVMTPLPAVRPHWPGSAIELEKAATPAELAPTAKLLRTRHSIREFDDQNPITLAELARFLDATARVLARWQGKPPELGDDAPDIGFAGRPYPSGGGSWPLELYLAVEKCDGLARGYYYYAADVHALVPIGVRLQELDALFMGAEYAMGAAAAPQVLITIAARFGRVSWKYSALAYALILKEVGVLMQTFYLAATEMGLGGCAIGSTDIELFAHITSLPFHVEGPVGEFALGRPAAQAALQP
jgi:SagB-type dehydrogenase family enzyme